MITSFLSYVLMLNEVLSGEAVYGGTRPHILLFQYPSAYLVRISTWLPSAILFPRSFHSGRKFSSR